MFYRLLVSTTLGHFQIRRRNVPIWMKLVFKTSFKNRNKIYLIKKMISFLSINQHEPIVAMKFSVRKVGVTIF